jgi:hemerythrin-like domain-containing protein
MTGRAGKRQTPTGVARLGNPLDFIHDDHARERDICAMIDTLVAADRPDRDQAARVRVFLREELPLHLEDEEQDLFPLLRRRCKPEDEIDLALKRLASDHVQADKLTPDLIAILDRLEAGDQAIDDAARAAMADYARHARHHLILEDAIILPFARLRLTAGDLETLLRRMLARRGLDRLVEARDAV